MDAALSILTVYREEGEDRPYEDGLGEDGYWRYKWQGADPDHSDNRSLRAILREGKPLVWFNGVAKGLYEAVFPVFLVGEEPGMRQFVLAITDDLREQWDLESPHPADIALRTEYAVAEAKRRLHQEPFRKLVLRAYEEQCALCRLRHHPELLDAAHIHPDSEGGAARVSNAMAMCAIHHRAFDRLVIGVSPDYVVKVREDVLEEVDGPTLRHALQGIHNAEITVPRSRPSWPDRELLDSRFQRFLAAAG